MDSSTLKSIIINYLENSGLNAVAPEDAVLPELAGMRIFDEPLIGIADAKDTLFSEQFKKEGVIGPHYMPPENWLRDPKSVVSFFLPFTEAVRKSNRKRFDAPYDSAIDNQRCSAEWLHARIEGQSLINALTDQLCAMLEKEGFRAVAPSTSPDFKIVGKYSSNWSERHAAYAAGLGTFGLSKGLITAKGMAGRFGSVITDAAFDVTKRPYNSPFEYCIMCGACQKRCPAEAIDISRGCALGKDQNICGPYVYGSYLAPHGPKQIVRYGCGKCQVAVPCEARIPAKPAKTV